MYIWIFIVFILITLALLVKFNIKVKPFTKTNKIKYILTDSDKKYFNKYGKILENQIKIPTKGIFYTTTRWNYNNYFKYLSKYYLIEPGYYYNIIPEAEFNVSAINMVFIE